MKSRLQIKDAAETESAFDAITYSKGAAVVQMARDTMGDEAFRKGLQNYMKEKFSI